MNNHEYTAEELSEYREIVENANSIILRQDTQGRITFANEFALRFFGFPREELLGKSVVGTIVPAMESTGRDLAALMREIYADPDRFAVNQNENVRKDGTRVWISWSNRPLRDAEGRVTGAVSVGNDISELRRTMVALRESEARFRSVFDHAPIGMVLADLEGRTIRANRALEEIIGCAPGGMEGLTTFDVTDPADHEATREQFRALVSGEHETRQLVERYLCKDGRRPWVKITAALVRDAADAPQFVIGMVEDITRRQEADEALEQERRMLRQMLALQEHDRRLIGYEIHDGLAQYLSGALMVLQSYQHLQSRNAPEALETLETGIGLARQAMQEARRLVGGLRPLVLDEMGIVAGIEYLIEQVESRGGPKVEFLRPDAFQRPSPLVENALFRIAQEGLANAMHHSKSDRVQIALSAPAGRIRLEIRDWGIGFDPQQVPEGHFGVEGIRERTRLLGGDAQIHSRPGQGTTVLVEVPAAEGA